MVEEELLTVAEVAREGGGSEGLKAELTDEAVGFRGESRVTGEEGDLSSSRRKSKLDSFREVERRKRRT